MRRPPALLLALASIACQPKVPEACAQMCSAAGALYGGCLDDWGVGWEGAGYADQAEFEESCEVWAWEMALLARDAQKRGVLTDEAALDRTCSDRATALSDPAATCEDFTEIDWNQVPWQTSE